MQTSLLSPAIDHKDRAIAHLQKLEFKQALACLEEAWSIDESLADLRFLGRICSYAIAREIRRRDSAAKLAKHWHRLNDDFADNEISLQEMKYLRRLIASRLLSMPFTPTGFCDRKESVLHRGVCHLALESYDQAYQELLTLVSAAGDEALPLHWGYLADAAIMLKRWKEANLGYLRLLFTAPDTVDRITLRNRELANLLENIEFEEDDQEVVFWLWPFRAWLDRLIEIPPGNNFLLPHVKKMRSVLGSELLLEPQRKLRQFNYCLYIDQSKLRDQVSFDVRMEMKTLEPELFGQYLAEVEKRNAGTVAK